MILTVPGWNSTKHDVYSDSWFAPCCARTSAIHLTRPVVVEGEQLEDTGDLCIHKTTTCCQRLAISDMRRIRTPAHRLCCGWDVLQQRGTTAVERERCTRQKQQREPLSPPGQLNEVVCTTYMHVYMDGHNKTHGALQHTQHTPHTHNLRLSRHPLTTDSSVLVTARPRWSPERDRKTSRF